MFKFLGNKLFGAKKQESQKPKHRLTISIPSTKYDPPSKHTKSNKSSKGSSTIRSASPSSHHHRSKSNKSIKYKPTSKRSGSPRGNSSKHKKSNSNIQQLNTSKNGKLQNLNKAASSSQLNSPFRAPPTDPTRPIFQKSAIFHANSSLKVQSNSYPINMYQI